MDHSDETEAITNLATNMRDAWNRGDITAFDSAFSDDVDFVDTSGKLFKGRDKIAAVHSTEIEGRLKGSQMVMEKVTVRFLKDGVAIAHIDATLLPGNRRTIMTALAMKTDDAWSIAAAHNSIKT